MAITIRSPIDAFKAVEKAGRYRFWDKERERSNHAKQFMDSGGVGRRCPRRHQRIAYSGPPHDAIRTYVCVDCHAAACEPEIRDRGFTFDEITDWEMDKIFDLDLERQAKGSRTFAMNGNGR